MSEPRPPDVVQAFVSEWRFVRQGVSGRFGAVAATALAGGVALYAWSGFYRYWGNGRRVAPMAWIR